MIEDNARNPVQLLLAALEQGPELENFTTEEIEALPIEMVRERLRALELDPAVPPEITALVRCASASASAQRVLDALHEDEIEEAAIETMPLGDVQAALHGAGVNYRAGIERVRQITSPSETVAGASAEGGAVVPFHRGKLAHTYPRGSWHRSRIVMAAAAAVAGICVVGSDLRWQRENVALRKEVTAIKLLASEQATRPTESMASPEQPVVRLPEERLYPEGQAHLHGIASLDRGQSGEPLTVLPAAVAAFDPNVVVAQVSPLEDHWSGPFTAALPPSLETTKVGRELGVFAPDSDGRDLSTMPGGGARRTPGNSSVDRLADITPVPVQQAADPASHVVSWWVSGHEDSKEPPTSLARLIRATASPDNERSTRSGQPRSGFYLLEVARDTSGKQVMHIIYAVDAGSATGATGATHIVRRTVSTQFNHAATVSGRDGVAR